MTRKATRYMTVTNWIRLSLLEELGLPTYELWKEAQTEKEKTYGANETDNLQFNGVRRHYESTFNSDSLG